MLYTFHACKARRHIKSLRGIHEFFSFIFDIEPVGKLAVELLGVHRKLQLTEITSRGSYFVGLVLSPQTFGWGFVLWIASASGECHLTLNPLPNITLSHRADSGDLKSKQALRRTTDISSSFPSSPPRWGLEFLRVKRETRQSEIVSRIDMT